ncbi:Down syndrome critical region protein 3 homolog [Ctenocephalides felis]|uniref:Down syndrome critical region protein 3 homolog n=1 Tax=Ctenocephalides felis TaxID=7515 RepID=UPI000E6E4B89|nr:Down syndrome critical region protein 3 homolog [Ctenocephalides felis]
MSISVDIKLKKNNKIFFEGEVVAGIVEVKSNSDIKHDGITLSMEGLVNLQLSSKNVGILESFYNSVKPIQLIFSHIELASPGKIPAGKTEIPFEFLLKPSGKGNKVLFETYHGVFINITYLLKCDLKRNILAKDLQKVLQFIIQYKPSPPEPPVPVVYKISPDSLLKTSTGRNRINIPRFSISGRIDSTVCCITSQFTGEVVVESTEVPIKSIELQLVRVETCGCAEGYARDATEIQNIQIGDGNVCTNIPIPIYMIFPRLFTCPTLVTNNFKVEFEINLVIIFNDDYLVTENFPIQLKRFN